MKLTEFTLFVVFVIKQMLKKTKTGPEYEVSKIYRTSSKLARRTGKKFRKRSIRLKDRLQSIPTI